MDTKSIPSDLILNMSKSILHL